MVQDLFLFFWGGDVMDESCHDELTEKIIGAAIAVHRELGPGLLKST